MKQFTSSVLSIKSINESSSNGRVLMKSIPEQKSPLVRLLEFDESIALQDLQSTKDYYLALLKYANNANMKTYDAVCQAIFNKYDAVNSINGNFIYYDSYDIDDMKTIRNLNDIIKKNNIVGKISVPECAKSPNKLVDRSIIMYPFKAYAKKILNAIETKNFDEFKEYDPSISAKLYSYIGKMVCNNESIEDIDELVDSFMNCFEFADKEVDLINASETISYTNMRIGDSFNSWDINDISRYSGIDGAIKALRINTDGVDDPNILRNIVQNVCDMITTATLIASRFDEVQTKLKKSCTKRCCSDLTRAIESNANSFQESLSMFGDKGIDSSNIFDLLDGEDFNNSYYMDLSLIADHEATIDKIRTKKEFLIKEAMMITKGGDIDHIVPVIEAGFGAKIKEGFSKIIEFLKGVMNKFVESIMFNFATEKAWLTKYRNIILNSGFDPNTEITFYCNIDNAVNKIQRIKCPAISYQQLKQTPDDFTDENTFFKKYFGDKWFNDMDAVLKNLNLESDTKLADKCKYYLGAKLPNGASYEGIKTFGNISDKMSQMYQWLLETEKLAKETKNELNIIEKTVNNYIRQANALGVQANKDAVKPDQTAQPGTGNASFFDYKAGSFLLEADVKPTSGDNTTNPGPAGQAQKSNTQRSNSSEYKQSGSQAKEEIKNSGDDPNVVAGRMEIYLNVCKAVLTAKATAITFAHKEILDVMRAIVKGKLGNSADIKLRNQNNGKQQGKAAATTQTASPQQAPISPQQAGNRTGSSR